MDPLTLFFNLLPKILELNLLKVENADLSMFRLQDSTVNLGCINTENFSIQIYVDGTLPDHAAPSNEDPAESTSPKAQWDPDLIASATQVVETPVFNVNRLFEFNTAPEKPTLRITLNSVPILLAQPAADFTVAMEKQNTDIRVARDRDTYQFDTLAFKHIACPDKFRITGGAASLTRCLNRKPAPQLIEGGAHTFGLFSLEAGKRLPLGSDWIKFSSSIYADVLAVCRLQSEDRPGHFALRSFQLIAIQQETTK